MVGLAPAIGVFDTAPESTGTSMQGKIAVEEHVALPETAVNPRSAYGPKSWEELKRRQLDIHDERLRQMDAHGIEMMVLSLNAPAVQAVLDAAEAADLARRANDWLANEVRKRPGRFQAMAALAMQDPELAIRELERSVKELGFKGVLVNGFSQYREPDNVLYYDLPQYRPFWATVERLGVPFYLHPRSPLPRDARLYAGHPWLLGAAWAFSNETAVHVLRLMGSGLFDEHPRLSLVIGHMGELIPFALWRIDNCNAGAEKVDGNRAKKTIADYVRANLHITTSGNFSTNALTAAIRELGTDRVMFSVDWPFEQIEFGAKWFDDVDLSEDDRRKIGRDNAARLFKLNLT
jgi:2,3-dihydroxybenzoate decarboxylase